MAKNPKITVRRAPSSSVDILHRLGVAFESNFSLGVPDFATYPASVPKLSDSKVKAARPYKLFDTDGLYLVVSPSDGRWWRQKYHYAGKEQLLNLGTYPDIGLAEAGEKRDAIRKLVARGVDPSADRKAEKARMPA